MLRGIKAFEACWLDLKDHHPTSRDDNCRIAQAMGQLVDRYQTPEAIENELPQHLKALFRSLALAYFQGYTPQHEVEAEAASVPTGKSRSPEQKRQAIADAVEHLRQIATTQTAHRRTSHSPCLEDLSEAETLIIEFPEDWPHRTAH